MVKITEGKGFRQNIKGNWAIFQLIAEAAMTIFENAIVVKCEIGNLMHRIPSNSTYAISDQFCLGEWNKTLLSIEVFINSGGLKITRVLYTLAK